MKKPVFSLGRDPGIYFDLPLQEYLDTPALSASGIKTLKLNPLLFWMRSWMNPEPPPDDDTLAKLTGKAYHSLVMEGQDVFDREFPPEFVAPEGEHILNKNDELKDWLRERGLPLGGNKPDLIKRIKENITDQDNLVEFAEEIKQTYFEKHQETATWFVPADVRGEIELANTIIKAHPQLSKCFTGGFPEVSLFWYDEETGIPMKIRIDYLKTRAMVDLKSMANQLGKPMSIAPYHVMAQYKYHIQASLYLHGMDAMRKLFASMKKDSKGVVLSGNDAQRTLALDILAGDHDMTFLFVFQEKGIAPQARGFVFPRQMMFDCGMSTIETAKVRFQDYWKTFGPDAMWLDIHEIETMDDDSFPPWAVEI